MAKFVALIASVALLAVAKILASPIAGIIDSQSDPQDIGKVASHVCASTEVSGAQIGRISTIAKLDDYFHDLPEGHELSDCSERYHDSLHSLRELVQVSSSNVCSDESVSAIENFHHDYITGGAANVPQILRLFFLQYASQVSATCEKTMLENLESTVGDKFSDEDYLLMESSAPAKASRRILFGADEKPDEDHELLLLSSLIEKDSSEESVNPLTGAPVQLYMKEHDTSAVNELSEKCHNKFKPVYKSLVLPVIRLANLGYSEHHVVSGANELVKKWYSIAQVCEIVLSIRFIQDPSLKVDEVVSISKSEAEKYPATESQTQQEITPLEVAPVHIGDELDFVKSSANAESVVEKLSLNIQARDEATKRAIKRLSATVERLPQNKVFVSLPDCDELDQCSYNLVDLKESVGSSLKQLATQDLPQPAPLTGSAKERLDKAKKFLKDEKEAIGNVAYGFKWLGIVLTWTAREMFSG